MGVRGNYDWYVEIRDGMDFGWVVDVERGKSLSFSFVSLRFLVSRSWLGEDVWMDYMFRMGRLSFGVVVLDDRIRVDMRVIIIKE